jgi:mannose-6-phosphate isomerase
MPLRLGENRVCRVYRGGALLEAFRGSDDPGDGDFPEDWVGSVTPAANPPGCSRPGEGLSTVVVDGVPFRLADLVTHDPVAVAGRAIVDHYGATTALLVKLLDAGRRLPVHAHPVRDFARQVLGSPFGKAESWIVLATREIAGQAPPRVWLGFRDDVGREELADWVA